MQVGAIVTYTPTTDEQPMAQGQPQAALCTAWDADTLKAGLIVFPANGDYGMHKKDVLEGTDPGTFQPFVLSTSGASAQGATAKSEHEVAKHDASSRKERQY